MTKTAAASRFATAATRVDTARAARNPSQCKLCRFLRDEPKVDADYIQAMLEDAGTASAYIAAVLHEGGVQIGETSVKRHRREHLRR